MKEDKKQICSVCGKEQAKTECDNCGTVICGECCKLEIWGTGAEDLSARYFCPACKDNPDVNPWGAYSNVSEGAEKQEQVIRNAEGKISELPGANAYPVRKKGKRDTDIIQTRICLREMACTYLPTNNGQIGA